jgi:hypothetical protein
MPANPGFGAVPRRHRSRSDGAAHRWVQLLSADTGTRCRRSNHPFEQGETRSIRDLGEAKDPGSGQETYVERNRREVLRLIPARLSTAAGTPASRQAS